MANDGSWVDGDSYGNIAALGRCREHRTKPGDHDVGGPSWDTEKEMEDKDRQKDSGDDRVRGYRRSQIGGWVPSSDLWCPISKQIHTCVDNGNAVVYCY